MKYVEGSMSVEAALIYPFMVMISLVLLELGVYFAAITEVKCICDEKVREWREEDSLTETELSEAAESSLEALTFLSGLSVETDAGKVTLMSKMRLHVTGSFTMFYPISLDVYSSSIRPLDNSFVNGIDWFFHTVEEAEILFQGIEDQ